MPEPKRGTYRDVDAFELNDGTVYVRAGGSRIAKEYVALERLDPAVEKLKRLQETIAEAYSSLTRANDLGPDVTETAVEAARMVLADALVAFRDKEQG